jgi:hypothetical protein
MAAALPASHRRVPRSDSKAPKPALTAERTGVAFSRSDATAPGSRETAWQTVVPPPQPAVPRLFTILRLVPRWVVHSKML